MKDRHDGLSHEYVGAAPAGPAVDTHDLPGHKAHECYICAQRTEAAGPAVDVDRLARALERFDITAYNVDPHGIALDAYEAARDIAIEYARLTHPDPTGDER